MKPYGVIPNASPATDEGEQEGLSNAARKLIAFLQSPGTN
jgi:hypothetical protein